MCMPGIENIPYIGDLFKYCGYVPEIAKKCYSDIQEPGEAQERFYACARTTIGLAAVKMDFASSMIGAFTAIAMPNQMKYVTSMSENMLTGLWNGMSPNQKLAAVGTGIIVTYMGLPYLWIPAAICSAKVGADQALKNLHKEMLASTIREVNEKMKVD